jgi:hypothetical protein
MNFFAVFSLAVACLISVMASCLYFHKRGYRLGSQAGDHDHEEAYQRGYDHGHLDADNWWLNAEQQVDQARQQIWKEEAQ